MKKVVRGFVAALSAVAALYFVYWTFGALFFGPMIFIPGANQGPLLGIFITGPLGLMFGGAGGLIHWFARGRHAAAVHDQR